ncbi:MAG: ribonuclease catalytic domain-containing protein [Treponema sp.]|nr:ribonuclease catalytic domain-containing protein [Treponema sp.]
MITENSLVIYKSKPAIVKDRADGKFTITLQNNEQVKVRDKDIELIHPGPAKDFKQIESGFSENAVREIWELLLGEENAHLPLKELASLIGGEYTPSSAYAVFALLKDGLYFSGDINAITPRSKNDVEAEKSKRNEKLRESDERSHYLEKLKSCLKNPEIQTNLKDPRGAENAVFSANNVLASRYLQDVEALAYGKSAKSRTMKDLGLSETPEDAHSLLLKTGFWSMFVNPHPSRFGMPSSSASFCPDAPLREDRRDLRRLAAFAIDSPWSNDPDDAVSVEKNEAGKTILYVHVADPASSITFDSPAEKDARDRGATLYLPEGAVRMLAEEALPLFALGLSEESIALTFQLTIDDDGTVITTDIFPSIVKVDRITYEEADNQIKNGKSEKADALRAINEVSEKIFKRRIAHGAINIDLPDIHITVKDGKVDVEPIFPFRSGSLIRECMIAAGEGAGTWACERGLAFPYISQEVELQGEIFGGLAGAWQLRRCMRPRVLSSKPGHHQGLGLNTYSQVTSPLRRYTDLLAHLQIRAFLHGEKTISADDISARLGFCEAAAVTSVQVERASNNHWLMVYLSGKKDSVWEAVALDKKGNRMQVIIPSLALETQVSLQKDVMPNESINLLLKSVNISRSEAVFIQKTENK